MEPVAGLYIAYQVVRGIAAVAGANQALVELSDRFIEITKIVESSASATGVEKAVARVVDERGADAMQAQLDRLSALLMLLAHSEVEIDLTALRATLKRAQQPPRIGDVLFLRPDSSAPVALDDIPRLAAFSALRRGFVRWDSERRRMEITGVVDKDIARLPGRASIVLDQRASVAEIGVVAGEEDRLRFVYACSSRSGLLPIRWKNVAPVLQVWRLSRDLGTTSETLLAELIVPVPSGRRKGKAHGN